MTSRFARSWSLLRALPLLLAFAALTSAKPGQHLSGDAQERSIAAASTPISATPERASSVVRLVVTSARHVPFTSGHGVITAAEQLLARADRERGGRAPRPDAAHSAGLRARGFDATAPPHRVS